jgi:hypothetical protein
VAANFPDSTLALVRHWRLSMRRGADALRRFWFLR